MLSALVQAHVPALGSAAASAGVLSTGGVLQWMKDNAIPLLILIVGAGIFLLANRQDHKGAMSRTAIVLVGLAVVGLAGAWQPVSHGLLHLVGLT